MNPVPIENLKIGDRIRYVVPYRQHTVEYGAVVKIDGSEVWVKWDSGRHDTYFRKNSGCADVYYHNKLERVLA
jgi:hypothetical protein